MPSSEPNFDAKMVDWLYDELDPAEAKSFQKHLEDNPAAQAEADALKRTRVAFQALEQSEPSAGLSSMLMHEAAQAVTKSPSLWAQFTGLFQPILMHPAASAMATLVVVVGVAGALYSRKGDMSVQPTTTTAALEAPAESPAGAMLQDPSAAYGAPQAELDDSLRAVEDSEDYGGEREAEANKFGYRVGVADESAEGAITAAKDAKKPSLAEEKSAVALDSAKNQRLSKGRSYLDSDPSPESEAASRGGYGEGNRGSSSFATPPPPPKARKEARSDKADDFAKVTPRANKKAKNLARKKSPSNAPAGPVSTTKTLGQGKKEGANAASWEDQQTSVLNAASKAKRCRDAGRIANDILDKKPSYYKKKVQGSKAVGDCSKYVAIETKRRAKVRQKQAARARKKAAGTPKKAKAAPQRDQATSLD